MSYDEDEKVRAKRRAMYILASRDHSSKELYDKLIKSYPEDLCDEVVALMEEYGYIDDEKYGRKIYKHYLNKGWGKSKIRFEMKRRGLPESHIQELENEYDCEDFIEQIEELIVKKYSSKLDFSDFDSVRRVTAALARRGYAFDDIKIALKRVQENETE